MTDGMSRDPTGPGLKSVVLCYPAVLRSQCTLLFLSVSVPIRVKNVLIGSIFHTNLSARFFALDLGGDIKKIQLFRIGINHFISDYWHADDYYVTVGASYHQYKLGSYMKGKHLMAQLSAGHRIGLFNYWAFAQWQKSPHEFYYEDELDGNGVVKIDGPAVLRTGAGCGIQLWKFYIHAEGSGFKPMIGALGIGLQF